MEVFVWLENVGRCVEDVIEELSEQQSRPFVLLLRLAELALKTLVLLQKCLIFLALHYHVSLLLLQFLLKEVYQVLIATSYVIDEGACTHARSSRAKHVLVPLGHACGMGECTSCPSLAFGTFYLIVEGLGVRKLLFQPLDYFLAEMASFGKFLFDLFVDFDLTLVSLDLLLHLVILEDQDFSLFGLMFELRGELMVLQDGQVRRRLQLFVIHGQKVRFRLLYIEEHLFAQLLSLLDPIELLLIDLFKSEVFLIL